MSSAHATSRPHVTDSALGDSAGRLRVSKGHGTENDFVLVHDPDAALDLSAPLVRALADRRAGLGGDGVIRLVRTGALARTEALPADSDAAEWFMDYRNADGSVAEMCGNGVRVAARLAERHGVWDGQGTFVLGTRAGLRAVRRRGSHYAVDMGPWSLVGGTDAAAAGVDAEVQVAGLDVARPALRVSTGNPHTVLAVADEGELAAADLTCAPVVAPVPAEGTNVELVLPLGERQEDGVTVGRIRMRVHERGSGETRSCGTGACAAAMAVRTWAGAGAPDAWDVEVPGGTLQVRLLASGHVELAGPAVLVADAVVDVDALVGRDGPDTLGVPQASTRSTR